MELYFNIGERPYVMYDSIDNSNYNITIFIDELQKNMQNTGPNQAHQNNFRTTITLLSFLSKKGRNMVGRVAFQTPGEENELLKYVGVDMLQMIEKGYEHTDLKVAVYEASEGDFECFYVVKTSDSGYVQVIVESNKKKALNHIKGKTMKKVESNLERLALESFFELQGMYEPVIKQTSFQLCLPDFAVDADEEDS